MPRDSAFARSLAGASAYWDEHVELTAQVLDAVRLQSYYLLTVNGNNVPQPEPTARPGVTIAAPEAASLADFGDFLRG